MRRDKERVDWHLILALAVAVLCCLLQDYSTFSFTPAFRIPIPIAAWENRRHPEPHERPPLPIITDLDGDNKTEILSVLPDGRLQLWSMQGERPQVGADDEWPQPRLVKEVLLESKADVGRLGRPIAMVTGKLWANRTGFESQQQVIVVDDGGAVKCYDAKLRLVWESHLHGDRAKHIEHHTREAAVAITALPLRVGDVGAVIVGRRFQVTNKRVRRNPGRVFGRIDLPEPESPHDHDADEAAHFSYYAFEGQTGALRWRHEAGDFYQVMEHERPVHEALADSKLRHLGEVEWTLYSEDLVASFPHHWYHRGDTHFALRHFERRTSIGSTAPSPGSASAASVAPSAAEEHALRERMHAEKPNVVVAFREKGLEAVHLYSGRTLCELHVPPRELHADINGDMILEQMIVHREGPSCWLAATAGIPPVSPLWNVSVCGLHLFAGDKEEQGVAPLLAVPTPPHAGSELLTYATAVLVESGRVTLVDPEGRIVWSTQTEAKWKTKLHTLMWQQLVASRLPFGHSSVLPPDYGTVPASPGLYRFPMAADTSPVDEHVLAVAWGLALLDRKTGEQLATASMPTPPTGEAVVGDFNGDGVNDVIIPTAAGFYAFVLERSLGFALYPLAVAGLVCTLGVQYLLRHRHAAATTTKRKAPPLLKSSHVL